MNPANSELLLFLRSSPDVRAASASSVKQGLYAGSGAVAGGLLLGPVGGMVGGIAGSVYGWWRSPSYDGCVKIISTLPPAQQEALLREVSAVLVSAGAAAGSLEGTGGMAAALAGYASRPEVRDQIWGAVLASASE
jgi:hypothetical protein